MPRVIDLSFMHSFVKGREACIWDKMEKIPSEIFSTGHCDVGTCLLFVAILLL
jgi:hypothetical protein